MPAPFERKMFSSCFYFLLCITCSLCQNVVSGGSEVDLRGFIGLSPQGQNAQSDRRAVIILSGNQSAQPTAGQIRKSDLIGVALDMEDRDPNSLYVHFDGENLVSSQPVLFNDLEASQASLDGKWSGVMDGIKAHRGSEKGPLADLLIFESYPDAFPEEVSRLCDALYSTGNCHIVQGSIAPEDGLVRIRRAAHEKEEKEDDDDDEPGQRHPWEVLPKMPYTAAFQLLFWTTLIIFLIVYGVAWGMWNMDPGRDSIIYRMTSAQKYKKDK